MNIKRLFGVLVHPPPNQSILPDGGLPDGGHLPNPDGGPTGW
jgi:hypothetical protein